MKLTKKEKRHGAFTRFRIQSEVEFNDGKKANGRSVGTYAEYLVRKNVELDSLKRSLNAH